MQTITLKTRSGKDGIVRLAIPTDLEDQDIEIVLVMHPLGDEPLDEMGYPIGYFEQTYGIFADDLIARNQPFYPDTRDKIQ